MGIVLLVVAVAVLGVVIARRLRGPAAGVDGELTTEVAVRVGVIQRATLHRYVTAFGRVTPEPPAQGTSPADVIVGSSASGLLVGIDCEEGRRVRAGDTLFRLDSRLAEVAVTRARQALDFAEKTLHRQQSLMEVDGTSSKALLGAEQDRNAARSDLTASETQLALLRITAPVAGTVVRIDAHVGQSVETNTPLARVIDLDRLVVQAAVPSREAALLRAGQAVVFGPEGSPGGKLIRVGTDIDQATDTVPIRASIPAGADFQPGRFLELRIVAEERLDRLAVEEAGVVTRPGEGTWIVLVQGDQAVRKPVTAGLEEGGLVEVMGEGLKEGMPVVTDEAYSLPEQTKIRILGS